MIHRVALLSGSLRKASTNTGLLRAVVNIKHPSFSFDWIDISEFPVFNEQIQVNQLPLAIRQARNKLYKADAVLFGIPEYNFTISSPFKNAYDWLSRKYSKSQIDKIAPVYQKTAAIVSSGGGMGGARAQNHFRDSAKFCRVKIMQTNQQSTITIKRFSGNIFNDKGDLIDEGVQQRLKNFLNLFDKWIKENKKT